MLLNRTKTPVSKSFPQQAKMDDMEAREGLQLR
jgi:hypothetical protein